MKSIALDIGDVWVGIAISDALKITCRPLDTVRLADLENYLKKIFVDQQIDTVVVGYPITMSGKESDQTKSVVLKKNELEEKFGISSERKINWILWDERLSSKRAQQLQGKQSKTKEAKLKEHAIAASYILQSFLDFSALQQS